MAKMKLETVRNTKGYSLRTLVRLSGVSKSAILKIENNECSPSLNTVEKLAKGLNVSMNDLFDSKYK